jgi:uncharacterized membrane protein
MKKLMKSKTAKSIDISLLVEGIIIAILGVILIVQLVAGTATPFLNALRNLSQSGLPLSSFWSSTGFVAIAFIIGVILVVVTLIFKMHKHAK